MAIQTISPEQAFHRCDPGSFSFETTSEVANRASSSRPAMFAI